MENNERHIQAISLDYFDTLGYIAQSKAAWVWFFLKTGMLTAKSRASFFKILKYDSIITNTPMRDLLEQKLHLSKWKLDAFQKIIDDDIKSMQLFPETNNVLWELKKAGYTIIITSNLAKDYANKAIELLQTLPDHTVFSFECGARKPESALFQKVIEVAGCEPSKILHVGDKYNNDFMGAKKCGLSAFRLDRSLRTGHGTFTISSLTELIGYLKLA